MMKYDSYQILPNNARVGKVFSMINAVLNKWVLLVLAFLLGTMSGGAAECIDCKKTIKGLISDGDGAANFSGLTIATDVYSLEPPIPGIRIEHYDVKPGQTYHLSLTATDSAASGPCNGNSASVTLPGSCGLTLWSKRPTDAFWIHGSVTLSASSNSDYNAEDCPDTPGDPGSSGIPPTYDDGGFFYAAYMTYGITALSLSWDDPEFEAKRAAYFADPLYLGVQDPSVDPTVYLFKDGNAGATIGVAEADRPQTTAEGDGFDVGANGDPLFFRWTGKYFREPRMIDPGTSGTAATDPTPHPGSLPPQDDHVDLVVWMPHASKGNDCGSGTPSGPGTGGGGSMTEVSMSLVFGLGRNPSGAATALYTFTGLLNDPNVLSPANFELLQPFGGNEYTLDTTAPGIAKRITGNGVVAEEVHNADNTQVTITVTDTATGAVGLHVLQKVAATGTSDPGVRYTQTYNGEAKAWDYHGATSAGGGRTWREVLPDGSISAGIETARDSAGVRTVQIERSKRVGTVDQLLSSEISTYKLYSWGEVLIQSSAKADGTTNLITQYEYHTTGNAQTIGNLKYVFRPDGSWESYEYDPFTGNLLRTLRPWLNEVTHPSQATFQNSHSITYQRISESESWEIESIKGTVVSRNWVREWKDQIDPLGHATRWSSDQRRSVDPTNYVENLWDLYHNVSPWKATLNPSNPLTTGLNGDLGGAGYDYAISYPDPTPEDPGYVNRRIFSNHSNSVSKSLTSLFGSVTSYETVSGTWHLRSQTQPVSFSLERKLPDVPAQYASVTIQCNTAVEGDDLSLTVNGVSFTFIVGLNVSADTAPENVADALVYALTSVNFGSSSGTYITREGISGVKLVAVNPGSSQSINGSNTGSTCSITSSSPGTDGTPSEWSVVATGSWSPVDTAATPPPSSTPPNYVTYTTPPNLDLFNGLFKITMSQRFNADYSFWDGSMQLRDETSANFGYGDLRRVVDASGAVTSYSYERGTWDETNKTFNWSPPPAGQAAGNAMKVTERHFAADPLTFVLQGEDPIVRVTQTDYQGLTRIEQTFHGTTLVSQTVHDYDTISRDRLTSTQDGVIIYSATQINPTTREERDATGTVTRTISNATTGELVSTAKVGYNGAPDIVSTQSESGLTSSSMTTAGTLKRISSSTRDLAGRTISSTDENGGTVITTYALGGRQVTETYPDGGTRITEQYVDGRLKSVTGTALVSEFHAPVVNADGSITETVRYGTVADLRLRSSTSNGLGWQISQEQPSPLGGAAVISTTQFYNTKGQRIRTETTGRAPQLVSYDAFGRLAAQGVDLNLNGLLDAALGEPITSTQNTYEQVGGSWWEVSTTIQTLNETSRTDFVSRVQKRKLGGGTSTLMSEQSSDGSLITTSTVADPATKTVTSTVSSNRSSLSGVRTVINGLLISESGLTATGATTYVYDGLERLSEVTDPAGVKSKREYDDLVDGTAHDGVKQEQIKPAGSSAYQTTATYIYNPVSGHPNAGRLRQVTQRGGGTVIYDYDKAGRVLLQSGTAAYPIRYEFDVYGELWKMHTYRQGDPTGPADTTTWERDPASGAQTAKRDAKNVAVNYTYEASGQLHERLWARQKTDGARVTTTYTHDLAGRLERVDYNDGTPSVVNTFYADGQLRTLTDAAGTHTYTYAGPGGVRDGETIGSTSGLLAGAGVQHGFDGLARRNAFTWTFGGQTRTTSFGYSGYGHLQSVTASGKTATITHETTTGRYDTVSYGAGGLAGGRFYDGEGRLQSMTWMQGATGPVVSQHVYGFNAAGRREAAARENGEAWGYAYNDRGEVTGGSKTAATAGAPAKPGHSFGYQYDGIGNRVLESVNTPAGQVSLNATADNTNALVSREHGASRWVQGKASSQAVVTVNGQATTRDAVSGEFNAAVSSSNTPSADYHAVEVQAVLAGAGRNGGDITVKRNGNLWFAASPENFVYDVDGNMTADGRWLLQWDGENRLVAMETAPLAVTAGVPRTRLEFAYDGQSRRIRKRMLKYENGAFEQKSDLRFLYDGWNLVAEFEANILQRSYAWGPDLSGSEQGAGGVGGLLIVEHVRGAGRPGAVWYPCYDGNGNVSAYINAASGAVEEQHDYDPFGNEVVGDLDQSASGLNCPFKFSTKYTDAETGLLYYGYRYYAPELGRWLNRDPIGERGGLNLYGMVGNDAINDVDVLGHDTFLLFVGQDNHGVPFQAAAETKKKEIKKRSDYNPECDNVAIVTVSGFASMESALGSYKDIIEIYIYSHGNPGILFLGTGAQADANLTANGGKYEPRFFFGLAGGAEFDSVSYTKLTKKNIQKDRTKRQGGIWLYSCYSNHPSGGGEILSSGMGSHFGLPGHGSFMGCRYPSDQNGTHPISGIDDALRNSGIGDMAGAPLF